MLKVLNQKRQHQKTFFKPQSLFYATIWNAIEKSHRLFVEGTTVTLTSGLACKKTPSLQRSFYQDPDPSQDVFLQIVCQKVRWNH